MKIKDGLYLKEYEDGAFYLFIVRGDDIRHSAGALLSSILSPHYINGISASPCDLTPKSDRLITFLGSIGE